MDDDLCSVLGNIEDIKEKLGDQVYKETLEAMMRIHEKLPKAPPKPGDPLPHEDPLNGYIPPEVDAAPFFSNLGPQTYYYPHHILNHGWDFHGGPQTPHFDVIDNTDIINNTPMPNHEPREFTLGGADGWKIRLFHRTISRKATFTPDEKREAKNNKVLYHIRSYIRNQYNQCPWWHQDYILNPETGIAILFLADRCKRLFRDNNLDHDSIRQCLVNTNDIDVYINEMTQSVTPTRARVRVRVRVRAREQAAPRDIN